MRLRRPAMAEAVLQVVWTNQPTIRGLFLEWLRELTDGDDVNAQLKAAHALGRLATYDFTVIAREFLEGWARSERIASPRLAAWALEAAALDNDTIDIVHGLLRGWATEIAASRRSPLTLTARQSVSPILTKRWGPSIAL